MADYTRNLGQRSCREKLLLFPVLLLLDEQGYTWQEKADLLNCVGNSTTRGNPWTAGALRMHFKSYWSHGHFSFNEACHQYEDRYHQTYTDSLLEALNEWKSH